MRIALTSLALLLLLALLVPPGLSGEPSPSDLHARMRELDLQIAGQLKLLEAQVEAEKTTEAEATRAKLLDLLAEQKQLLTALEEALQESDPEGEAPEEDIDLKKAVVAALDWLADHQDPEGFWHPELHWKRSGSEMIDALGRVEYTPGVTGLALLAFLGDGHTHRRGAHMKCVKGGFKYLKSIQDEHGCFGPTTFKHFVYNHAIATLAMVRHHELTHSATYKRAAQNGVDFIQAIQNPGLAWRYGIRPGDNDTSVTGWMVAALGAARNAGLKVDDAAFAGARAWVDKMTDPNNGRVGYVDRGGDVARPSDLIRRFPPNRSEAQTAEGLMIRILSGTDPAESRLVGLGVGLLRALPPQWNVKAGTTDHYYWHWATQVMCAVGDETTKSWRDQMRATLLANQKKEGRLRGSWDPAGPWGLDGGRVYSTALLAMIAETLHDGDPWFLHRGK